MMHRCCGNSQGHVMGQCTCGIMYHNQNSSNFPMLFSIPNNHNPYDDDYGYGHDMYSSSSSSSSSSSVDCTLSLGTPSTRLTEHEEKRNRNERSWDLLQPKHNTQSQSKTTRGSTNGNSINDSLLARRCANCDTTSTPLWRNGPRGPKSLCNACGIRFKKEERRASAAAATSTGVMESPNMYSHHNNSWYANSQSQKMSNELRFMDNANRDSENDIPNFLSWRLNVADRTSLVHDFTI